MVPVNISSIKCIFSYKTLTLVCCVFPVSPSCPFCMFKVNVCPSYDVVEGVLGSIKFTLNAPIEFVKTPSFPFFPSNE